MAKDIQIKYINNVEEWEELYPVTKTRIITDESGLSLDNILSNKTNKNEVYTSVEIDSKLKTINDNLDEIGNLDIPIQKEEPENNYLWFEII